MNKWDERSAVAALNRKNGVSINYATKTICFVNGAMGNKSWGKADYLRKNCGYIVVKVKNLAKSVVPIDIASVDRRRKKEIVNVRDISDTMKPFRKNKSKHGK